MRELVSVIIPVYNVEKYISGCIESVLRQTYDELEILLIDDGSKDQSAKICEEYAQRDARIKVVHKMNGGVSSARNEGIRIAKGSYVSFVDSDDWIEPNAVELLYSNLKNTDADLVSAAYSTVTQRESILKPNCARVYENNDIALNIVAIVKNAHGSVCGKLFKKDVIDLLGLSFRTDMPMGEDSLFVAGYLQGCKRVSFIQESIYNYNRVVTYSAVKKYYEKYGEYNKIIFEQLRKIIAGSEIDEADKERCVSMIANRLCCISVCYYMENCFVNKRLVNTINPIVAYYQKVLNEQYYNGSVDDLISNRLFSLMTGNNIRAFLKAWYKEMRRKHLARYFVIKLKIIQRKMKR